MAYPASLINLQSLTIVEWPRRLYAHLLSSSLDHDGTSPTPFGLQCAEARAFTKRPAANTTHTHTSFEHTATTWHVAHRLPEQHEGAPTSGAPHHGHHRPIQSCMPLPIQRREVGETRIRRKHVPVREVRRSPVAYCPSVPRLKTMRQVDLPHIRCLHPQPRRHGRLHPTDLP